MKATELPTVIIYLDEDGVTVADYPDRPWAYKHKMVDLDDALDTADELFTDGYLAVVVNRVGVPA